MAAKDLTLLWGALVNSFKFNWTDSSAPTKRLFPSAFNETWLTDEQYA
jgi:hypothetical protein